jgi:hypothetical protein
MPRDFIFEGGSMKEWFKNFKENIPGCWQKTKDRFFEASVIAQHKSEIVSQFALESLAAAGRFGIDAVNGMFHGMDRGFQHLDTVLMEGNYHSEPRSSLVQLLKTRRMKRVRETIPTVAAETMVNTTRNVGTRFLWLGIFTALTTNAVLWCGVALGTVGYGIMAYEYLRAKKTSRDIIKEVNFAGQLIEGERADLCRLHVAQAKIMNLSDHFERASLSSTCEIIREIMSGVTEEARRIRVLHPGKYGASEKVYAFSEPSIKLVGDRPGVPVSQISPDDISIDTLMKAWCENAERDALLRLEVADNSKKDAELRARVAEIERALEHIKKSTGPEPLTMQ